ncbi:MAG: MFS transporter [Firmicutes bacterium]|jgi:MFS family permease|nr:MFS transporter [Bacillota bacterium]
MTSDHPYADQESANIRTNTFNGGAQAIALNLVNPFLGIDLVRLGANNFELSLVIALPPLAVITSTLLGAHWIARVKSPHRTAALLYAIARIFPLGLLVVNLLSPSPWQPVLMVILIGAMNIPIAVANLTWQAIISALFRPQSRNRAVTLRTVATSALGIVTLLGAALIVGQSPGVSGYPWIFGAAFLAGMVEVWWFLRLRGDPPVQTAPPHLLQAARRVWALRDFRRYTLASIPFYFGWQMAQPLFVRYQVSDAHATNAWIAIFSATNALCSTAMSPLWGRFGHRVGPRYALPLATSLLSLVPVVYALNLGLHGILLSNIVGGAFGAGVNMFLLLRLMEVAPEHDRIFAIGMANTLIATASVLGPFVSVVLVHYVPIPAIFWIPAGLRLVGAIAFFATVYVGIKPRHDAFDSPSLGR